MGSLKLFFLPKKKKKKKKVKRFGEKQVMDEKESQHSENGCELWERVREGPKIELPIPGHVPVGAKRIHESMTEQIGNEEDENEWEDLQEQSPPRQTLRFSTTRKQTKGEKRSLPTTTTPEVEMATSPPESPCFKKQQHGT